MPITSKILERNQESNKLLKESITIAFFQLLEKNDFNDIKITDICERAGVSRTGFYRNFKDKKEIIDNYSYSYFLDVQNHVIKFIKGEYKDPYQFYMNYFKNIQEHKKMISSLRKAGFQAYHLNKANEILIENIGNKELEYRILIFNGAIQNIALYWLSDENHPTLEEVSTWCTNYLKY